MGFREATDGALLTTEEEGLRQQRVGRKKSDYGLYNKPRVL